MKDGSAIRNSGLLRCQEHLARTLAARMGAESVVGKALAEMDERRSRGEDVTVCPMRGRWLVRTV
jgi:hypothetical protein